MLGMCFHPTFNISTAHVYVNILGKHSTAQSFSYAIFVILIAIKT